MRIDQLQAASWWEKLKALFHSPLALTLLAVCVVLFIAIVWSDRRAFKAYSSHVRVVRQGRY